MKLGKCTNHYARYKITINILSKNVAAKLSQQFIDSHKRLQFDPVEANIFSVQSEVYLRAGPCL